MHNGHPMISETGDIFPDRPSTKDVLSRCSLFEQLSTERISELAKSCHSAYVERGNQIWSAGQSAKFFAVIGEGIVRLTRKSPQGREIAVEVLGPGHAAGVLAIFSEIDYPLSALAVTNVWYIKVSIDAWRTAIESEPTLREMTIKHLSGRLLEGFDLMAAMLSADVEQRMALSLLRVHDLLSPTAENHSIAMTRQSLAEMACTTVESAIRVTSDWQRKGWIKTGHRAIVVNNKEALLNRIHEIGPVIGLDATHRI